MGLEHEWTEQRGVEPATWSREVEVYDQYSKAE